MTEEEKAESRGESAPTEASSGPDRTVAGSETGREPSATAVKESSDNPQPGSAGTAQQSAGPSGNRQEADDANLEADMIAMLDELPAEDRAASADDIDFGSTSVSKAEFQHLSQPAGVSEPRNIELLMDVNLPVSIELGRTKMSISDILGLGPGSVVELNKLAGEPVDVMVNQKLVARGEVVVIDENFGVRITQLMTPEERLKLLNESE